MDDSQIIGFIQGRLSADKRKEVISWICESEANRLHFQLMQTLWEKPDATIFEGKKELDAAWEMFLARKKSNLKSGSKFNPKSNLKLNPKLSPGHTWRRFAVAASLVLITLLIWLIIKHPQKLEYARKGEGPPKSIELPDGTKVWLNRNSTITLSESFNEVERNVRLSGEAYFEVFTNPEKPFKIHTNEVQLRVLGTSFNVMAYRDSIFNRVDVSSGRVAFRPVNKPANKIELTRNMSGWLDLTTGELDHGHTQDRNRFAWVTRELVFEDANIHEISQVVAKVYHVELKYDERIDCVRLKATFSNEPLANILNTLKSLYNLDYSRVSENKYQLVGKCNQPSK